MKFARAAIKVDAFDIANFRFISNRLTKCHVELRIPTIFNAKFLEFLAKSCLPCF